MSEKLEFSSMAPGNGSAIPCPPKPGSRGPVNRLELNFPASPGLRAAEARAQQERLANARREYARADEAEKKITRQRLRREGVDEGVINEILGEEEVR